MPGKVADFLRAAELDDVEQAALDQGVTVRRGQGYTLRVTAAPAVHHERGRVRVAAPLRGLLPAQYLDQRRASRRPVPVP